MRALSAQTRTEVMLTARRGDAVLLAVGIPVGLLVFFSLVRALPLPAGVHRPVDFLTPGILALAVMSTAMVSLAIATGYERHYGVLKRLGATPLGRPRLLAAKVIGVLAIEVAQGVVLLAVAAALGWGGGPSPATGVAAALLGTVAFGGIGLLMAGSLRAEVTLAAANGLYLLLLLAGGMVIPLGSLPGPMAAGARALPAAALSRLLDGALGAGSASAGGSGVEAWVVLAAWAVAAPIAAAATFRWE